MNNKKVLIILVILSVIIVSLINSPMYYVIRSYLIMLPYSYIQKQESILHRKDIDLYIKSGISTKEKDWYPFILYYNADEGFSKYTGKNLSLSILYSFGAFNYKTGSSTYYDSDSKYYSSFYGGYVVYNHDNPSHPFGFSDDMIVDLEELTLIPKYDQTKLVLPSIGCSQSKITFSTHIENIESNINYIKTDGWTKIDSTITTNSPIHASKDHYDGYIQYGKPSHKLKIDNNFPLITLKGRMYVKYDKKHNVTVILYVLAPNLETIQKCDKDILSTTNIQ